MKTLKDPLGTIFIADPVAEKMTTVTCQSCRMALYMSVRKMEEKSWKCPSCGSITRT